MYAYLSQVGYGLSRRQTQGFIVKDRIRYSEAVVKDSKNFTVVTVVMVATGVNVNVHEVCVRIYQWRVKVFTTHTFLGSDSFLRNTFHQRFRN